ncbi:hypothetical protein PHJA_001770500, partial [Phtheirospermum japonicum]
RTWSVEEEKVLVQGLKDLVTRGWKADNGFKAGYAFMLEKHMAQHFPGTDIKAEPHITLKMHVWKKHYGSLSLMQSRSGFGWNDLSHTVTVEDDDIWAEHVKFNPSAKAFRFKAWPFYKDWVEVFGKDRATGEKCTGLRGYGEGRTWGATSR